MKRIALCLLLCAGVAGCATGPASTVPMRMEVDSQKVAAVERAAARNGVKVIWLTAPMKAVPAGSN